MSTGEFVNEADDYEPRIEDFNSVREWAKAYERFHDARTPTDTQTLERATRLGSESIRAVLLQLRRLRTTEPEDAEWLLRRFMDAQYLIVALWRLRVSAHIALAVDSARGPVSQAVEQFDDQLPDLARMRHVAQHLDDYAIDHPTRRRQKRPNSTDPIGRRSLEVMTLDENHFKWLGGTIQLDTAMKASIALWKTVRESLSTHRTS